MKRAGIIAISLAILALVFVGVRSYRLKERWVDHRPYQRGATALTYVGKQKSEFDGQEFAVFNFGNAEGVGLKLEGTIAAWEEASQSWEERPWDLATLPNRRVKEVLVGQKGKWKLEVRAYANPSLGERLSAQVSKSRPRGGLVGAWSSPEMTDSSPLTNRAAISPELR